MKRKVLFNKAYEKLAGFAKAFDEFFERLHEYKAKLESLITDRFHFVESDGNEIRPA